MCAARSSSLAAWIRFSLDAGTPETYAAVRRVRPETFGRVLDHVRGLAEAIGLGTPRGALKEESTA